MKEHNLVKCCNCCFLHVRCLVGNWEVSVTNAHLAEDGQVGKLNESDKAAYFKINFKSLKLLLKSLNKCLITKKKDKTWKMWRTRSFYKWEFLYEVDFTKQKRGLFTNPSFEVKVMNVLCSDGACSDWCPPPPHRSIKENCLGFTDDLKLYLKWHSSLPDVIVQRRTSTCTWICLEHRQPDKEFKREGGSL